MKLINREKTIKKKKGYLYKIFKSIINDGFKITVYKIANNISFRRYKKISVHGNKMIVRTTNDGVSPTLIAYGKREVLETRIVKEYLRKNMVFFDLGANIGYYTLLGSSLIGLKGRCYALEPVPSNYKLLLRNIKLNKFNDRVKCERIAIWDNIGLESFYIGKTQNVGTLLDLSSYGVKRNGIIKVKTITLDKYCNGFNRIDLLRMDIEGGEIKVINGMTNLLKQNVVKAIFTEMHPIGDIDPDPRFNPMIRKLLDSGFTAKYLISSNNPVSLKTFEKLKQYPLEVADTGHGLFENIPSEDLLKVAARRPKIARAIFFLHNSVSFSLGDVRL